jgi:hypothetical protein
LDIAVALTAPPATSIDELPDRLAAIAQALSPNDGLASFNRLYQLVTESVKVHVGAGFFSDPTWMSRLDVVFGNLYLDAVRASVQQPGQVPRAWAALLDRRADTRVRSLQFALAGMNAHINRDLPVAVARTCTDLNTSPDAGAHHADFERVNAVLAQVEPVIRQSFLDAVLRSADRAVPGLQDVVANFDMVKARETAWANAETLWTVNRISLARGAEFLGGLDHLVGFAGRGLLVPLPVFGT